MNNLKQSVALALRNLFRRGQHNVVKILCLALGLASSAVYIAEIYYEQTYDQHYPDYDRICRVTETFKMKAQPLVDGAFTSGGVAPLMKKTIPEVELATRVNPIVTDGEIEDNDKVKVKANIYLADSCFFRMFPAKILQGDADKALTDPFCCAVNRSTAERLGGNVIGRRIRSTLMPSLEMTIVAVYDDYPHNSTFHRYDVIGSLNTQRNFSFDGQDELVGNDRYSSFVKIRKGVAVDAFKSKIQAMLKTHYPMKDLQMAGVWLTYKLTPISQYYTGSDQIRQMFWILSILAFVLLAASVLNYVLIVVGNMVSRAREMAVRKCYGAGRDILYSISFSEALIHLLIAVALGALLLWVCHGSIEQLLSAPLRVLFFNRGSWILVAVCLLVLVVGGIIPGWLYNRMPVAVAFHGYVEAKRRWKVWLLGIEFAMVSFLLALLTVINLQYRHTVDYDMGYQCKNIAMLNVSELKAEERQQAAEEVKCISGVKAVSACSSIPFYGASGNNVMVPGEDEQLFNVADLYTVSDHYFDMLQIPVVAGKTFAAHSDSLAQVMVSERFAAEMKKLRGWNDVVGRKVFITEHSGVNNDEPFTIIGVFKDFHMGSAESNWDQRPIVIFYGSQASTILIQFDELTAEGMTAVQNRLQRFFPGKTIVVQSMENEKNMQYESTRHFRSGVMTSGLVVLFITLLGLVGYVNDEVNRRHKEIAIRKVNGARATDVVALFLRSILKTAGPASIVGVIGAWYVAAQWLMLYDNRITLHVWYFVVVVIIVLLVVAGVTLLNCHRVVNSNPTNFLKQE